MLLRLPKGDGSTVKSRNMLQLLKWGSEMFSAVFFSVEKVFHIVCADEKWRNVEGGWKLYFLSLLKTEYANKEALNTIRKKSQWTIPFLLRFESINSQLNQLQARKPDHVVHRKSDPDQRLFETIRSAYKICRVSCFICLFLGADKFTHLLQRWGSEENEKQIKIE